MCFAEDHLQYCLWNHNKESESVLCFLSMAEGGTIPTDSPSSPFSPIAPPQNNLLHGGPKKSYKCC